MNDQTSSLESRINDLRRDVDELLASTTRRTSTMRIILIIICVAMIGYMSFIYSHLATVDANLVASLAEMKIQEQIEDGGKRLAKDLNARAPALFDQLEERVIALPDMLAENGRNKLNEHLDNAIPGIEEDMTAKMFDLIDRLADKAYETNKDEMTEGDFQQLMDAVADEFVRDTLAMMDSFHAKYQEGADPLISYIDELASGKDLGNREKHHRDILLAALAILEKKAAESNADQSSKPKVLKPAPAKDSTG